MRIVLVLALIHGLVPALGEVAEAAVHYAVEGHLAHSSADQGDLGDLGDEHGCGTTVHHCDCCPSQELVDGQSHAAPVPSPVPERTRIERRLLVSVHDPAPPRRPPILA